MSFSDCVQPTHVYVLFSCDDAFHGALSVYGKSDAMTTLTLSLQHAGGVRSWEIDGDSALIAVNFQDADALIVLARRSGAIIASGVFEIDCALAGVGLLLVPRAISNLIVHQEMQIVPPQTAPLQVEQAVQV